MNYALCTCYKKAEHYCKNWDGKGDAAVTTNKVKEACTANETDPDTCEFLIKPTLTEGFNWVRQTTSGSPIEKEEKND